MRIRRNIIAPLILTIGAVGSLVAVPAVSALTAPARVNGVFGFASESFHVL